MYYVCVPVNTSPLHEYVHHTIKFGCLCVTGIKLDDINCNYM